METNQLAVMAKNGDLQAFEELYNSFARRIFSFIRQKIQNRQDAEDVLQEVFYKSYKGLGSLRPGKLNFPAWLFTIAANTINDHLRKKYRQPEIVGIDEDFDISDGKSLYEAVEVKSELEGLMEKFRSLPERHRDVLELRFFKHLTVTEAAKALKKSTLAVSMLQYRARKKLRELIEENQEALA